MVVIKNDFITDTSQSDAKIARLQAQILKLKEAQAEMHRESKEGPTCWERPWTLWGKGGGACRRLRLRLLRPGAIRKGYEDWAASAHKAADETDRLNTSIMQGMAEAGKTAQMPQLEAWINTTVKGRASARLGRR